MQVLITADENTTKQDGSSDGTPPDTKAICKKCFKPKRDSSHFQASRNRCDTEAKSIMLPPDVELEPVGLFCGGDTTTARQCETTEPGTTVKTRLKWGFTKNKSGVIRRRAFTAGAKPQKCRVCHKRFNLHSSLIQHLRCHTRRKLRSLSDRPHSKQPSDKTDLKEQEHEAEPDLEEREQISNGRTFIEEDATEHATNQHSQSDLSSFLAALRTHQLNEQFSVSSTQSYRKTNIPLRQDASAFTAFLEGNKVTKLDHISNQQPIANFSNKLNLSLAVEKDLLPENSEQKKGRLGRPPRQPNQPKISFPQVEVRRHQRCEICKCTFYKDIEYQKHMAEHKGKMTFSCKECDVAFSTSAQLNRHYKSHPGARPYKCSECDKSFVQATHLKNHEATHTGEKNHKCNICGKRVRRKAHLEEHMYLHGDKIPFKCRFCDKIFNQPAGLRGHMRRAHPGETKANLRCHYCPVSFESEYGRYLHIVGIHQEDAASSTLTEESSVVSKMDSYTGLAEDIVNWPLLREIVAVPVQISDNEITVSYGDKVLMMTPMASLSDQILLGRMGNFACDPEDEEI